MADLFLPGQPPSARRLNDVAEKARRAQFYRQPGGGGGGLYVGPAGILPWEGQRPFVARITSTPTSPEVGSDSELITCGGSDSSECRTGFGFIEQAPDRCGGWYVPANPWQGDGCNIPAYEISGRSVSVGSRVIMHPGDGTWFYFTAGGGGGDFDWHDVIVSLREDHCNRKHFGEPSVRLWASRIYSAIQVEQQTPPLGAPQAAITAGDIQIPDGARVWEGNDIILEINGHAMHDGTRVLIRQAGTMTLHTGGTMPDGVTLDPDLPPGTQLNIWHAYYHERDPTCWMRVLHRLDGDDGCKQCWGYLGIPGPFYANSVTGATCIKGEICQDDSDGSECITIIPE